MTSVPIIFIITLIVIGYSFLFADGFKPKNAPSSSNPPLDSRNGHNNIFSSVQNIEELNNKGIDYYNQGKYDEAITWFDKALALDPNNSYAQNNKEIVLSKLNKK